MNASKPYLNVFEAIEDDPVVAENLLIRAKLMDLLREKIVEKGLNQEDAARKMSVTQPRISDLMRGKIERFTIDMLVNEIDITNSSLDKFPIFAAVGVREVWRYDGVRVGIFILEADKFVERVESMALPKVTGNALTGFVESSQKVKRTVWMPLVRKWARAQLPESD